MQVKNASPGGGPRFGGSSGAQWWRAREGGQGAVESGAEMEMMSDSGDDDEAGRTDVGFLIFV